MKASSLKQLGLSCFCYSREISHLSPTGQQWWSIQSASRHHQEKVIFSKSWVNCLTHQFNTVSEPLIESEPITLQNVGKIVSFFEIDCCYSNFVTEKHANLNYCLPNCFSLVREVPVRFVSTIHFIKQFFKSASKLQRCCVSMYAWDDGQDRKRFSVSLPIGKNGFIYYPTLEEVINVFAYLYHSKTKLKPASMPTMVMFIATPAEMKTKLSCLSTALVNSENFELSKEHTQKLARKTLNALNQLHHQDV